MTPASSRPSSPPFPYEAYENSEAEDKNPTVVPREILEKFHFTFLIRHPRSAIPSYYRCCIPPLVERTQFAPFMPEEAGYDELRRLFDYLKDEGLVGPKVAARDGELKPGQVEICVIDADDMLDDPEGILRQYCDSIGLEFDRDMLQWDSEESHAFAREQFEKWNGFHDDAINSTDLKPRLHVSCSLSSFPAVQARPLTWSTSYTDDIRSFRSISPRAMNSSTPSGLRSTARKLRTSSRRLLMPTSRIMST